MIFVSVTRHVLAYLGRPGGREEKVMTVAANEFICRFLLHVLADGFHRIRHYGFLANGGCNDHLARLFAQLGHIARIRGDFGLRLHIAAVAALLSVLETARERAWFMIHLSTVPFAASYSEARRPVVEDIEGQLFRRFRDWM